MSLRAVQNFVVICEDELACEYLRNLKDCSMPSCMSSVRVKASDGEKGETTSTATGNCV